MFYSLIIKLPILRINANSFIFDPQKIPTRSNLLSKNYTQSWVSQLLFLYLKMSLIHGGQKLHNIPNINIIVIPINVFFLSEFKTTKLLK